MDDTVVVPDDPWAAYCAGYDAALENAALACLGKVTRRPGYNGQWEGYGAHEGDMTGPECARRIRAMIALNGRR